MVTSLVINSTKPGGTYIVIPNTGHAEYLVNLLTSLREQNAPEAAEKDEIE